jgi:hypothetical protein
MSTTLLCWCRDDSELTDAAKNFPADFRYSGCRRAALPQTLGRLTGADVLVVTAHGAPRVFGEEDDAFYDFDVDQFADTLRSMAPKTWQGRLYLDICSGFQFAQKLKPKLSQDFPGLRFFGCDGNTEMSVDMNKHKEVL